jgi:glycine betaine transporter
MKPENLNGKKYPMNPLAFWPPVILLAAFIAFGVLNQKAMGSFLTKALYGMANVFGGYINLLCVVGLFLVLVLVVSKFGDIRIGGKDAKPDFKYFNWISISLCGGIGTGLLFWAMGEPIFHYATPPSGANVEPFTRDAGVFAVSQAMWDWSFIQYSLYSLCAVAFALVTYNLKKSYSFGSVLEHTFGRKIPGLETFVHALTIFTLVGAVANSMGVGLMQIGGGLNAITGVEQSKLIWLVVAIIIGVIFILSCLTGIGKGLKKLSAFTTIVFIGIMVYVAIFGAPIFVSKLGTESAGYMLKNWAMMTTTNNAMVPEDSWYADWIVQYWCSFIVYAPVIGMFLSRLAKGRTVKEFILVNVLAPSLFCCVWIAIFGGMTIQLQSSGTLDIWANINELGMQATVYQILGSLPLGSILTIVFVISIFTSFATLADPMTSVLSTVSIKGLRIDSEPPKYLKVVFGVTICTVSYLLVASGGIDAVRGMFTLVGLPISIVLIMLTVSSFRQARVLYDKEKYMISEDSDE